MAPRETEIAIRVRYSETDQMGTFYNSRALEWFESGRTEHLRRLGIPYAESERRGVFLPVVEAHVQYLGRARYDDLLRLTAAVSLAGPARVRFDIQVFLEPAGTPVVEGYTVHACADAAGKPIRPPAWLRERLNDREKTATEAQRAQREDG